MLYIMTAIVSTLTHVALIGIMVIVGDQQLESRPRRREPRRIFALMIPTGGLGLYCLSEGDSGSLAGVTVLQLGLFFVALARHRQIGRVSGLGAHRSLA